ncbi:flagellar biosynthetic protein FliO [Novosphingobium colocasiae]|uniref:Flagellar biogenesis protein n=1 Tax=Novosphingobium colocasiae TaxID=1256513 RepID=A0A918PG45_9SPHN|nr:flagellar biosynthetic protein FliO [Novosphingobium colocasiae]GGZ03824.1 hypothetical protein GCM10011614_18530 [Novosphingobium colocasiae]
MLWYILKLAILLPLIGGLAWVSLRFAKRMQDRALAGGSARAARVIETTMLSPSHRLAVIAFHDREILVGVSRGGMTRLAEAPRRAEVLP